MWHHTQYTNLHNALHIKRNPSNGTHENIDSSHHPSLDLVGHGSTLEYLSWLGGIERSSSVARATKTKAVGHVEEDINVSIDTSEEFRARTHGENWDVGKGVDTLCISAVAMLAHLHRTLDGLLTQGGFR